MKSFTNLIRTLFLTLILSHFDLKTDQSSGGEWTLRLTSADANGLLLQLLTKCKDGLKLLPTYGTPIGIAAGTCVYAYQTVKEIVPSAVDREANCESHYQSVISEAQCESVCGFDSTPASYDVCVEDCEKAALCDFAARNPAIAEQCPLHFPDNCT